MSKGTDRKKEGKKKPAKSVEDGVGDGWIAAQAGLAEVVAAAWNSLCVAGCPGKNRGSFGASADSSIVTLIA
jgi:hypothetical protein